MFITGLKFKCLCSIAYHKNHCYWLSPSLDNLIRINPGRWMLLYLQCPHLSSDFWPAGTKLYSVPQTGFISSLFISFQHFTSDLKSLSSSAFFVQLRALIASFYSGQKEAYNGTGHFSSNYPWDLYLFWMVLGIKPRVSYRQSMCSSTELHVQLSVSFHSHTIP